MMKHVDDYLDQLKLALAGSDLATIQDALADAEEYIRTALQNEQAAHPDVLEADALPAIIEEFGQPEEIAAAYRQIEKRVRPTLAQSVQPSRSRNIFERFFGVLADPRAWGALLYMFISLLTGILYFTWAMTGLSLSLGLLVLIIGIPFIGLFLLSVQGVALIEGRIVEALLGVRMPRRPVFLDKNLGWWGRFKVLITGKRTWLSLIYMILQLPLGVIYFSVFVTLLALALGLMAAPVVQTVVGMPIFQFGETRYWMPVWLLAIVACGGFLLIFVTMHLAKWIGRAHGALAKFLLVND
jgi:hypothetical protein